MSFPVSLLLLRGAAIGVFGSSKARTDGIYILYGRRAMQGQEGHLGWLSTRMLLPLSSGGDIASCQVCPPGGISFHPRYTPCYQEHPLSCWGCGRGNHGGKKCISFIRRMEWGLREGFLWTRTLESQTFPGPQAGPLAGLSCLTADVLHPGGVRTPLRRRARAGQAGRGR